MESKRISYFATISLNEQIKYIKLLFRWNGSVWKLLWADFVWFILLYIGVTLLYRLYLINDPYHKQNFETIVKYMNKVAGLVPLSFLLGFFVSTILGRWWQVVMAIPWMTHSTFSAQTLIRGKNAVVCRNIRLAFIRYLNLAWILSLMHLSQKVKHKFHVRGCQEDKMKMIKFKQVKLSPIAVRDRMKKINEYPIVKKYYGELIKEDEILVFEKFENEFLSSSTNKKSYKPDYIIPLMWATRLLEKALEDGYIMSEYCFLKLYKVVQNFRGALGTLSIYTEFNIPLVYTQVVIIVVYSFLLSEIFSQQAITSESLVSTTVGNSTYIQNISTAIEAYFPIFTIFKFLIYMGWFKIGLSLVNPFGREKNDLPLDMVLDYNLEIAARVAPGTDNYFPDFLTESMGWSNSARFEKLTEMQKIVLSEQETNIDNYNPENDGDTLMQPIKRNLGAGDTSQFEIA